MDLLATTGPYGYFGDAIVSIVEHNRLGKRWGLRYERLHKILKGRIEFRHMCLYIRMSNTADEGTRQPDIADMTLVKELDAYLKIELSEDESEKFSQVYTGDAAIALYQGNGDYAIIPMHRPTTFHTLLRGAGWI